MGDITGLLLIIAILISCIWIIDITKRDELQCIRHQLKRIADALERRKQE